MKAFIAAILITASASAETLMFPVQDLLFEVPNFTNAPDFPLNEALNGNFSPQNPTKMDRKARKELEKKLIDLMWEFYPDAESIKIWNGTLFVRMP